MAVGKDDEFEQFVTGRINTLIHAGVLLGGSVQDAEDYAQITLMKTYVKWAKVKQASNIDAYLMKILFNTIKESKRRRWWGEKPTQTLPETTQADESENIANTDAINQALGNLNKDQREAIVLKYYMHLTETQIAETLGVAPGTVKSRISRGLHQLAENINITDEIGRRTS